ncbi:MAG: DUF6262 family protein [Acidimicrobiia bacterium]|nr:DUF6262 family protein [Acidimicrobiia bacterium]
MTRADNTHHLRQAAAARHTKATDRVTTALVDLDRSGQPMTFTAVADAANVSRSWLYTQPALRDTITSLRSDPARPAPAVPATQRATTESLRQRLDTTRQDVTRLRAENQALRHQLALALGEQRTH